VNALDRTALLLGSELSGVERFVPALRRSNLSIRRVASPATALQLAYETALDLIVVVLPVAGVERVLGAVRAAGSASLRAGVVLVGPGDGFEASERLFARYANRVLPPGCSDEEFERAASELLEVEPRFSVRESTGVRIRFASDASRSLQIHNLSASGMLLTLADPLPVGAVFGFALDLPDGEEPIRGQAEVVRTAGSGGPRAHHVGVRFLTLGGDGRRSLSRLVERELANDNERTQSDKSAATAASPTATAELREPTRAELSQMGIDEIAHLRQELSEIATVLDAWLERGLTRKLGSAEWYLTGGEVGLESLRTLSLVLAALYEGRDASSETTRRMIDLADARRKLAAFGRPEQDLASRVRILVGLRPALERLLDFFGERRTTELSTRSGSRPAALTTRIAVELKRLVAERRSLDRLRLQLQALQKPRYAIARGAARHALEELREEFAPLAERVELDLDPDRLVERQALRAASAAVERHLRHVRNRLTTVHEKVYGEGFARRTPEERETDLVDPGLHEMLAGRFSAGVDYLARARSAYRYGLEGSGVDVRWLERVERLGLRLETVERAAG
jgi:hypothetical protein